MGNCIYKQQVDNNAQQNTLLKDQIIEDVFNEEENIQQSLTPQPICVNQQQMLNSYEPTDSQTPNVLNSQNSNTQMKFQQDLQLSPDMLVLKQKDGEKFLFHYEIIKKLGQGGFGSVYQVRHIKTKLIRAAKVIDKQTVEDESTLLSETEILKNLDHPNIVKILEVFSDSQHYYIVTECLEGGELLDRIKSITHYNEEVAKKYMKEILSAMVYCHARKIVHRDLKPENILFDNHDVNSNLKIIDFGASEKIMSKKLTTKIGTPYYLAPEVITSNNGYDEKVDVWSCGVILYILLIGKAPFRGRNQLETLQLAQKANLDFNSSNWQKVSKEAIDLIKLMIQKDPIKRISMKEALNHSWIQNQIGQNIGFDQDFIRGITQFKGYNKLRVAIHQFISVQILKKEEQQKCIEIFKSLDKNGDGGLSEEELIQGMLKINMDQINSRIIVRQIIDQLDTNKSGKVDFTEFLCASVIIQKQILRESLKTAFRLFDLDGNGTISKVEIEEIFGGISVENEAWQDILKQCDNNQDGVIEEDEFITLLENLQ